MVECAIGSRGVGVYDSHQRLFIDQPYVVIREATREEWKADVESHGYQALGPRNAFYYEVSLD